MLSANNTAFQEAGAIMYEVSEDEQMRQILEAREDARRNENDLLDYMQERIDEALAAQSNAEKKRDEAVAAQNAAEKERDDLQKKLDLYRTQYGDLK